MPDCEMTNQNAAAAGRAPGAAAAGKEPGLTLLGRQTEIFSTGKVVGRIHKDRVYE